MGGVRGKETKRTMRMPKAKPAPSEAKPPAVVDMFVWQSPCVPALGRIRPSGINSFPK